MHASIVKSALSTRQLAGNMNEFTQERSRIHASIVKSALAGHQVASNMKESTQYTLL